MVENTLDTLDGVDVVKGVVAISDQGVHEAFVLQAVENIAICERDHAVSEALENTSLPRNSSLLSRALSRDRSSSEEPV